MKVSLNYIKRFLDFDLPSTEEVVDRIGIQLGAIDEGVFDLGPVYKDVLVVRVVDCRPIKDSDHLNLCKVDDGGKFKGEVERDADGHIQIVCGAPNVKTSMLAAWLPPASVVPSTFYDDEPFTLEARKLRGHVSNGMLASPKELAIGDSHGGILEIDVKAEPGDSFAKLYDLDSDVVIDIENKMFTHRPDCFGLLGVAREVAGIFNKPFKSPSSYTKPTLDLRMGGKLPLTVVNEIPELVPRFSALVINEVQIKPSPVQIQSYLSRMGIRPVNNIVDSTNLQMLETGQPLHAYDYHKLVKLSGAKPVITIRSPKPKESVGLLNSKTVKPSDQAILITSGNSVIGLGGVMGSKNSEVDDKTKAIVLESASFDMYSIRRSSMELGIFSDAVTRFNKGQSPLQTKTVLIGCSNLMNELCDKELKQASEIIDDNHLPAATMDRGSLYPPIVVESNFVNRRLGSKLSSKQMAELLSNVECQVKVDGDKLTIKAPFWRTDIEIREDVVEEVGRLYGYDKLEPKLIERQIGAATKNQPLERNSQIRQILARAGANELLNYSFISRSLLANANQDSDKAFEIANSLSPELNFYRLSLTPSLLSKVHPNVKAGHDQFALFELGTYHLAGQFNKIETTLPEEYQSLALVFASKNDDPGAAYYRAKNYLSFLAEQLGINNLNYVPLNSLDKIDEHLIELAKPFEPTRSALVTNSQGQQLGVVGEYRAKVRSSLKLPSYSAGFEILSSLISPPTSSSYVRPSKYPSLKQDMTLKVPVALSYAELEAFLRAKLEEHATSSSLFQLSLVSIFEPKGSKTGRNYSFRFVCTDYNRTLSDKLVNELLDKLAEACKEQFKTERV